MNIRKLIDAESSALKKRLKQLQRINTSKLEKKRAVLQAQIDKIDEAIARIVQQAGLSVSAGRAKSSAPGAAPATRARRTRKKVDPQVVTKDLLEALGKARNGINGRDLAQQSGLKYHVVNAWLKQNASKVVAKGQRRGRKYFLK